MISRDETPSRPIVVTLGELVGAASDVTEDPVEIAAIVDRLLRSTPADSNRPLARVLAFAQETASVADPLAVEPTD